MEFRIHVGYIGSHASDGRQIRRPIQTVVSHHLLKISHPFRIFLKKFKDSLNIFSHHDELWSKTRLSNMISQSTCELTISQSWRSECHNLLGCIAACTSRCRRGVYCNRKHGFLTAVIDRRGGNSIN
jgi:hypothetical protein